MLYNALLQAHTMIFPPTYHVLAPCAALDLTHLGFMQNCMSPGSHWQNW